MAYTKADLQGALPLVASGKVRDLYEIDSKTLLFVATDRISAFDVVMRNVSICLQRLFCRLPIENAREFREKAMCSI